LCNAAAKPATVIGRLDRPIDADSYRQPEATAIVARKPSRRAVEYRSGPRVAP